MLFQFYDSAINRQEGTVQREHSAESRTFELSDRASVEHPVPFGKYIEYINGIPLELARMPAGNFLMGNDKSPNLEEKPAHFVSLKSFYIGQYEITRKQWNVVVDALPKIHRNLQRQYIGPGITWNFEDTTPADVIFWDDAVEFCERLTKYSGKQYRLPSEAEWEYSCRAGTETEYSFGDQLDFTLAHFRDITATYSPSYWLLPVGAKGYANAWGLYDMHGNVAEWCLDIKHSDYNNAPTDGSAWTSGGNHEDRVQRGGQYGQYAETGRSSSRRFWWRYTTISGFGFRVVAEITPSIGNNPVTPASAASYSTGRLAADSIVALFGSGLSDLSQSAPGTVLPLSLAGVSVFIRDQLGNEHAAPLFFASPGQINIQIPPAVALGPGNVFVVNRGSFQSTGPMEIAKVSPGLFAADSTGKGVAAALVLRVKANGEQTYEPIARFDQATMAFAALPIEVGDSAEEVYLALFGTGFRHRMDSGNVTATVGGEAVEVLYAGEQSEYPGVDQCNLRLPKSLAGRGIVNVNLTVDQIVANPVTLWIK